MHDVSFGAGGNMLNNAHTCCRHRLTISIPPGHPLPSRHPTSAIFPAPRRVQTTRPTFTHTLQGSLRRINTYTSLIHPCLCRLQSNNFFLTLMGLKDFLRGGPALFTLYSRVGYFHLNESVWVAVLFKDLIFRQTCE